MLLQSTRVHILVGDTDKGCHDRWHQHIVTLLVIQIDIDREFVLEESHLEAEILLVCGLPSRGDVRRGFLLVISAGLLPRRIVKPVAARGITTDPTVGVADLHRAPPRHSPFPEFFLGYDVAYRGRREHTIPVVRRELLASSHTDIALEQVFTLVVISHTADKRLCPFRE